MPYSFHSHSGQYCHHGYGMLEDVVKEAIRKGFRAYGLSEHMPRFAASELYPEELEAKCTPAILESTFQQFHQHARQLQDQYRHAIQLLVGTEIEFIHSDYASRIAALRDQVDYVVGSLHHVGSVPIDFSPELYQEALAQHGNDHAALFAAYFDEQFVMLQAVRPEVVGHFDLIRIFAAAAAPDTTWWQKDKDLWNKIVRNVEFVINYGGLFEINSRAWKKGLVDAYPHRDIVQLIQSKGGRFTLSDDCHGPNDVGMHYDKLYDYLKTTGIESIHYLQMENGQLVVKEHKHILQDLFWSRIKDW